MCLTTALRTNLGISARELLSFSGIANKPDFSVGLSQAPTVLCLCVATFLVSPCVHWPVSCTLYRCSCVHLAGFLVFSPFVAVSVRHVALVELSKKDWERYALLIHDPGCEC